jgi:hypothetical protein
MLSRLYEKTGGTGVMEYWSDALTQAGDAFPERIRKIDLSRAL